MNAKKLNRMARYAPELSIFEAIKLDEEMNRKEVTLKPVKKANAVPSMKQQISELNMDITQQVADNDALEFTLHLTEQNEAKYKSRMELAEINESSLVTQLLDAEAEIELYKETIMDMVAEHEESKPKFDIHTDTIPFPQVHPHARLKVAANDGQGKEFAECEPMTLGEAKVVILKDAVQSELEEIEPGWMNADTQMIGLGGE